MKIPGRQRLSVEAYVEGIRQGDRTVLGRAITLVESSLERDQDLAGEVLAAVMPLTGRGIRVGITGVPGVGKSTFIDAFGMHLIGAGARVAVLAVDPSSQLTGGSILGDKTRMARLSVHPAGFVRPSPSGSSLGGVARKTREAMLLCEAAGYDFLLVETVGVGQSETAVHGMTDFFLLLMLAGAGDELQGIKKGIMEMADGLAINKADGQNLDRAKRAAAEYSSALRLFPPAPGGWHPRVLTCSALHGDGIGDIADMIRTYRQEMEASGWWQQKRQQQSLAWMRETLAALLQDRFFQAEGMQAQIQAAENEVLAGAIAPTTAARRLIREWKP